jgi:hypothetical protein
MEIRAELMNQVMSMPDDNDTIDRRTAAAMLNRSVRALQRWHHLKFGPPRQRTLQKRSVSYSRKAIETWLAEHGDSGRRRARSQSDVNCTRVDIPTARSIAGKGAR